MSEETTLLATELELVSDGDLGPLLAHFGSNADVLRDTMEGQTRTVWLELPQRWLEPSSPGDIDEAHATYVSAVEALSPELRAIWDACSDRCLHTGIQSGRAPHATHLRVSAQTLAGTVRIAVRLELTVYALD
jgi:hypothetical protein